MVSIVSQTNLESSSGRRITAHAFGGGGTLSVLMEEGGKPSFGWDLGLCKQRKVGEQQQAFMCVNHN